MIFIKLIKVLAAVLAIGLIFHLLFSTGKKRTAAGQRSKRGTHRKFIESSVIEKKDETSESDRDKS